jgi:phage-related protein
MRRSLHVPALFHPAAREALRTFPVDVRWVLGKAIYDLQIGRSRTTQGGLVFHAFVKKTWATPQHKIRLGKRRLKELLR